MHIHIENNILFSRVLNTDMAAGNGPAVGIMSENDIKKTESEECCCGSCS